MCDIKLEMCDIKNKYLMKLDMCNLIIYLFLISETSHLFK